MNLFAWKIISFALSFGLLIIAMSAHEFSHALVAYRLGDKTAKHAGRLTLNPLAHIDPIWTILVPLVFFISSSGHFVFGAAKPVPIDFSALKNPKRDIIWIGLSGPLANLAFALILSILLRTFPLATVFSSILTHLAVINVVLGVFNLIPIPPLDGSRILMGLLPDRFSYRYSQIEPYAFIILIALIWMGTLGSIIWPLVNFTLRLLGIPF